MSGFFFFVLDIVNPFGIYSRIAVYCVTAVLKASESRCDIITRKVYIRCAIVNRDVIRSQ